MLLKNYAKKVFLSYIIVKLLTSKLVKFIKITIFFFNLKNLMIQIIEYQ